MTFFKQIGGAALGAAMLLGAGLCAPPAQAAYIVDLTQVGANVHRQRNPRPRVIRRV